MTQNICRYPGANVELATVADGQDSSEELLEIFEAVMECDMITDAIVEQCAEVDRSIANFKETMYDVSDSLMGFSGDIFESLGNYKFKNEKEIEAGGWFAIAAAAVGALGLAAKGTGYVVSSIKQKRAEKKREKMEAELRQKKLEIIDTKYEPINNFLKKFESSILPRVQKLYDIDFDKSVSASDPLLLKKGGMFKRDLALLVKSRYMVMSLQYCIAEMEAWKQGKDDSTFITKAYLDILSEELLLWPGKIDGKQNKWDSFVSGWLGKQTEEYPLPVAMLFTDSTMLSNFVGVNIQYIDNCKPALLSLNMEPAENNTYPAEVLLRQNPYYIDCQENIKDNWCPPESPAGFGAFDAAVVASPAIAAFAITFACFVFLPGTFIRVVAVLVSLAVAVLFPLMFFSDIEGLPSLPPPYIKRKNAWNEAVASQLGRIEQREDAFRTKNSV